MERVYTIPLRDVKNVKRTIRAPRAIREIRTLIDEKGGNSLDIFPEHYQTRVIGYKK